MTLRNKKYVVTHAIYIDIFFILNASYEYYMYNLTVYVNGGIMVSMLSSRVVDCGLEPDPPGGVKPKTMKLVFVASPLSMHH